MLGPVAATDVGARTVLVLGQTVRVNGSTVFDPSLRGGLAALREGDVVAVSALADAQGHLLATRIAPAAAGEPWRLRGSVAALDAAAKRFRIGAATLDYAGAAQAPAALVEGQLVNLNIERRGAAGALAVAAFGPVSQAPAEAADAQVEGLVTGPASSGRFKVGGIDVDASQASIEPSAAALVAGAQAQIAGRMQGGSAASPRASRCSRRSRPSGASTGSPARSRASMRRRRAWWCATRASISAARASSTARPPRWPPA